MTRGVLVNLPRCIVVFNYSALANHSLYFTKIMTNDSAERELTPPWSSRMPGGWVPLHSTGIEALIRVTAYAMHCLQNGRYILLALYIILQCAEDNHLVLSGRGNSVARFFSLCYHDIAIWLSSCVRRVRCWNALSIPFFRHPRCSIRSLVILAAAAAKIPPFKPHGTRHKERTECEFLPVRMAEADSPS